MLNPEKLLEVLTGLLGIVLIAGVGLNFFNALLRYGFGSNIIWAEEVMIFGLILIVMAGIIVITARSEHLKIDILLQILPAPIQVTLRVLTNLVLCAVFVYLAWQSLSVVQLMMRLGQTSVAARIPMWIPHSFLLVSFGLAAVAALYRAVADVMTARNGIEPPPALQTVSNREGEMIWTLGALPLAALLLGLPVFLVLLLGVLATLGFVLPMPATMLHQNMFGAISSYTLLAVPFFLFAGELMGRGGISGRIIEWVLALVGRTPGAIGLVAVGTSGVYGAISGSSPATVASISRQLYPDMIRNGYSAPFSIGLINAGGAISVVIPPSINFLLYGAVAEQSIVQLFTAGILPGLLLLSSLALTVLIYAARKGIREGSAFSWSHLAATTRRAGWALMTPIIVLGSIYGGFATPTEAGGVACVYAIFVTTVIHRDLTLRDVVRIAGGSALLTAQIMVIVAAAGVFSWILTISGFQSALSSFVAGLDVQPWMILLAINVLLLVIGCFLDPTSAILTLTPLLLPIVVTQLGVDPIHFGIVMTVNLSIGMFTPPFGLNLFVTQATLKAKTIDIYRGVIPFALLQIVTLMIITYVPAISLILIK